MTAAAAPTQPTKRWLSKKEAADYLGVSERWMKRATQEGVLPFHKFRRLIRFDVRDLDAYAESQRVEAEQR